MNGHAKLFLVGAGPGDPDLITMKGVKVLQKADAILYDALCNPKLLDYSRSCALKINVGKSPRKTKGFLQEDINKLVLELSESYNVIVRLKGGDPFIFARGFEELESAIKGGLTVEVVPGISSSYAAPALENIPLTLRGVSESFFVITGTNSKSRVSSDFRKALHTSSTIIILMGVHKLAKLVEISFQEGKQNMPVAIIQDASMPTSKTIVDKMSNILNKALQENITSPSVIIIGKVVAQRDKIINSNNTYNRLIRQIAEFART